MSAGRDALESPRRSVVAGDDAGHVGAVPVGVEVLAGRILRFERQVRPVDDLARAVEALEGDRAGVDHCDTDAGAVHAPGPKLRRSDRLGDLGHRARRVGRTIVPAGAEDAARGGDDRAEQVAEQAGGSGGRGGHRQAENRGHGQGDHPHPTTCGSLHQRAASDPFGTHSGHLTTESEKAKDTSRIDYASHGYVDPVQ